MRSRVMTLITAVLVAGLIAPASGAAVDTSGSYLIVSSGSSIGSLVASVEGAGGTVTNVIEQVGLVVATGVGSFRDRVERARGVAAVVPNLRLQWISPQSQVLGGTIAEFANPPTSGDNDFFFDLQWGHDAVDAIEAWNKGNRGSGALVAVLDTGFDLDHPDLAPNIAHTANFTDEGTDASWTIPGDPFSHGTHTAGTVAAADNGFGVIGIAPEADLALGKVLEDVGCGTTEDVLEGIVWAADLGADIISMSLGDRLERRGLLHPGCDLEDPSDDVFLTARDVAQEAKVIGLVTTYAHSQGSLVIASAGNDGEDKDHSADVIHLPSDAPHVLSISATAPRGWAIDPTTDLDLPGTVEPDIYTNFGQSAIDFAAPGGSAWLSLPGTCTVVVTAPCWVFDLVLSTGNNAWFWAAGTSMSAPHAAGVAAIITGINGGEMNPAALEAALRGAADDLGKPGNDDFFGAGRVNAGNAG